MVKGYLLKQRAGGTGCHSGQWSCTQGGTTCTVVAVLDARMLVVANVGDSDAILCGASIALASYAMSSSTRCRDAIAVFELCTKIYPHRGPMLDCALFFAILFHIFLSGMGPRGAPTAAGACVEAGARPALVLTGEHSPESPTEFQRMRTFRPDRKVNNA